MLGWRIPSTLVLVVLALLPENLDARTKHTRLHLRLRREAPISHVPAWDLLRSHHLYPALEARVEAFRAAASSLEQLRLIDEIGAPDGPRAQDSTQPALLLVGLLLQGDSGPLGERVATAASSLPDDALSNAAKFYMRLLIAGEKSEQELASADGFQQAATGIAALCGLRGKQRLLGPVCAMPHIFPGLVWRCVEALNAASAGGNDTHRIKALHALKSVLECCCPASAAPRLSVARPDVDLEDDCVQAAQDAMMRVLSSEHHSRDCQIAAAQPLAILLLSKPRGSRSRELEGALGMAKGCGQMALSRFALSRATFGEETKNLRQEPGAEAGPDDETASDTLLLTWPEAETIWRAIVQQLPPACRERSGEQEALAAATQFLTCESASLLSAVRYGGAAHVLARAIRRVRHSLALVRACVSGARKHQGKSAAATLLLYRKALAQRDLCLSLAAEAAPEAESDVCGIRDHELAETVMAMLRRMRVCV